MKEGEIILVSILTSSGIYKKRPALVLKVMPKYGDLLLCGISSNINQYIPDFDLLIDSKSKDYHNSGLVKDSIARLSYLSILPIRFIEGKIGFISYHSYRLLIMRLCEYIKT